MSNHTLTPSCMGNRKGVHQCERANGQKSYATSWSFVHNLWNHTLEFSKSDESMDFWTCKF